MEERSVLGDNHIDDVRWICSLTESELDLLMGLKNLIRVRAKKIGHEELANKFDLKMLRALSFIFMENLKERLKDLPLASDLKSNLLNQNVSGDFSQMTLQGLHLYTCSDRSKRIADMFSQDMLSAQRQKTST